MEFFHTRVTDKAVRLVTETLRSGYLSEGERVREFEGALASQLGLPRPIALNSGTSALHLALVLAGVDRGDEVILPPQTFVASGLAIVMCGAKAVFADIQPTTGNIDPASVGKKITSRTRALMPVHWGGYPCDMEELNAVADSAGLAVIEDAAHALGATYKKRAIGSISRFTAFSFQAIKHLTTGDGGALCCMDEADAAEARRRRWFGIDRERDKASILGERQYNLQEIGYKYHMNDVAAALGLGNLDGFESALARHRQIAATYRANLEGLAGLTNLERAPDRESSHWMFTVLVERREEFIRALRSRGVPASVVHQRIDRNRLFGGADCELAGQNTFDARQVALPVHCALSEGDVSRVIEAVRSGW